MKHERETGWIMEWSGWDWLEGYGGIRVVAFLIAVILLVGVAVTLGGDPYQGFQMDPAPQQSGWKG